MSKSASGMATPVTPVDFHPQTILFDLDIKQDGKPDLNKDSDTL